MSLDHAFFYKSVNNDRVYDDTSFEHWLKKFFTSGVFLNDLQVTANEDMTVTVGAGYTNIDGKVKIFKSATPLIIETAGASYPRIDSIVLERNDTERDILLKVVKGGYSSEPVSHTPVRQDGVYQLVIAQILVNAGAVKVTQANITDTRSNTELCGIVAGAVEQIDFSQVQAQFDSYFAQYKKQIATDYTQYNDDMETYLDQMEEDFSAWFEGIRNQLNEDAAGHLQNQIDDIKAEMELLGGSIVKVTVEAGEYNVEGLEVNLVIDGKHYTETINDNVVKFTGVLEVGTAVIACVDEGQEFNAEISIEIPYYGSYECSIKSSGSYTDWIEAGGLNPSSYESLDALLEDEKAVRTLMTKKDAVDVLVNLKVGDLTTIINHPYVAKWVNYREYAYSTLSANPKIKILMDASGMYGMYITVENDGEWKAKGLVPVMTSNTAPYGEALTNSTFSSSFNAYNAFNEGVANGWIPAVGVKNIYLAYRFVNPTIVKKYSAVINKSNSPSDATIEFKASNNGVDWVSLDTFTTTAGTTEREIENNTPYLYYGIHSAAELAKEGVGNWEVKALQFYGRQLEALVPPMTSNTAPIGNVTYSTIYSATYDGWRAFDGSISAAGYAPKSGDKFGSAYVQYEFENPTIAKVVGCLYREGYSKTFVYKLQASNDGKEFETIVDSMEMKTPTPKSYSYYETNSDKAYKYYRFVYVSNSENDISTGNGVKFQLYGTPDYDSRNYIYEHGVEVVEISANGYTYSGYTVEEATKTEDSIIVKPSASSGKMVIVGTNDTIDLSAYSCIFAKAIDWLVDNNSAGYITTSNSKVVSSTTSSLGITTNNNCLDINNINASSYVCISNSGDRMIEVSELWIE